MHRLLQIRYALVHFGDCADSVSHRGYVESRVTIHDENLSLSLGADWLTRPFRDVDEEFQFSFCSLSEAALHQTQASFVYTYFFQRE